MKPILSAILCLMLLICLCACTGTPAETEGTSPAPTGQTAPSQSTQTVATEPQELVIPEIPAQDQLVAADLKTPEEWVFTNYEQTLSWQAPDGQRHSMTLVLPALSPVADFSVAYNKTVYELGQLLLDEVRDSWEKGYYPYSLSLTYETYTAGDVLFIVMERRIMEGYSMLYVDAFDLEERKQLYVGEITKAVADMDYPTFILAVTELVRQEYVRTYQPMIAEIEAGTYTGTDSYFATEPDKAVTEYYETLERLPYLTLYLSQARLFVDDNGELLLSVCIPETDGLNAIRTVIPFDIAALGWDDLPSEEQAYGYLLDIQHYVDGIHADAYSIMLTEAFFSDPEEFVEYAAVESKESISHVIRLLEYNLYDDQLTAFTEECSQLLQEDDLTAKERAFVNAALDAVN